MAVDKESIAANHFEYYGVKMSDAEAERIAAFINRLCDTSEVARQKRRSGCGTVQGCCDGKCRTS